MKQLRPLRGYVLIQPIDEEEKTSSGLIMPEKAKDRPAKGKVIGVGKPDNQFITEKTTWKDIDIEVKIGDIVIFYRWGGQEIKEGNMTLRLVKFADLIGIYEN